MNTNGANSDVSIVFQEGDHMEAVKKRILLLLSLSLCLLLLSGCSFSDLMSWGTGVKQDPDYQIWEKLSENGKLDQDGKYTADAIHVTFAESSFFDTKYYRDPEMKDELSVDGCYLLPGDLIFCSATVKNDVISYYGFDHLDVIEYSANNVRGKKLDWKYQSSNTVLMIPFDYKGTEVSIEPIGQYKLITVQLEQPKMGGHVIYSVNGQELTGETADLYRGAKVKGVLEADTGWEPQLNKNPVYTVTKEENQIVTFEGKQANDFFIETESHKPLLRLESNKNLKSCRMTIDADGYSAKDLTAGNGGLIIDNQRIGTGNGIKVSFNHFDLENDKNAVRLTVIKRTENTEYREIHYANETNSNIQIYFEYEVTYTNISLVADAVNTMEFTSIANDAVVIDARFCDVVPDNKGKNTPLVTGALGTNDRQIEVKISPKDGYVMTGSFVNDGVYLRRMRFDEFDRFVNEVLQNQLKKLCIITLDTNDPYGNVIYKKDGQEVSGKVEIMEGNSITICYTLKDEKQEINEERNIFDQINIFDGERWAKFEKNITIDRSMDGQTLTRESFIKLREKVN